MKENEDINEQIHMLTQNIKELLNTKSKPEGVKYINPEVLKYMRFENDEGGVVFVLAAKLEYEFIMFVVKHNKLESDFKVLTAQIDNAITFDEQIAGYASAAMREGYRQTE